jgi:PEGA domain
MPRLHVWRPTWAALMTALWAVCQVPTPSARAQADAEPEAAAVGTPAAQAPQQNPMEVAREHMERGQALYTAARYIESAEEFLRAYEAQPFAAFLYNAGVAYEKNDDPGRAADFFERFLQSDPQAVGAPKLRARIERLRGLARAREQELALANRAQSADAQEAARAQQELEVAKTRLAELETQVKALEAREAFKSLLSVQSKPEDATVTLKGGDGRVVQTGPGAQFSQTLDEGDYTVEVAHPKYKTISTPLHVAPGKVYVIIVEMSQGQFLGFLRVASSVPGAAVFVDKKDEGALGHTPFQNATPTGKHHVWIEKPGYKPVELDADVGVGDEVQLKVELERVDYGKLQVVASRPDAQVYVDGALRGGVPYETDLPHGVHKVRVSADGMKDYTLDVTIERGQATPVRVKLRPAVGRAGAWVTAGAAVAMLGGSIACSVIGKGIADDLAADRASGQLVSDDGRVTTGKALYLGADVGYGLTAAIAGLATYYFLRDPLPDSEGRALAPRDWAFNPSISTHGAGAAASVRF